MAKYSTQSIIPQDEWNLIISAFELLKNEKQKIDFPEDAVWKEIPVGKYLERIRQLRAEHKLTSKEVKFIQDNYKTKVSHPQKVPIK